MRKKIWLRGRNNRDRFCFGLFSFGCDLNISLVIVSKVSSGGWQSYYGFDRFRVALNLVVNIPENMLRQTRRLVLICWRRMTTAHWFLLCVLAIIYFITVCVVTFNVLMVSGNNKSHQIKTYINLIFLILAAQKQGKRSDSNVIQFSQRNSWRTHTGQLGEKQSTSTK